jgi:hypothetical protein
MRGLGLRLGRKWLAWAFDFLVLSMTEKKAILRDAAGFESPLPPRAGAKYLLARSLALVLAEHPAIFLAFPLAVLVIAASGLSYWIKAIAAFF